jgi:hypothetical protein
MGSKNSSLVAVGILHMRSAMLLGSIYHYPLRSAFLEIHLPRTRAGKKVRNVELHNLNNSSNIMNVIKSRRIK